MTEIPTKRTRGSIQSNKNILGMGLSQVAFFANCDSPFSVFDLIFFVFFIVPSKKSYTKRGLLITLEKKIFNCQLANKLLLQIALFLAGYSNFCCNISKH